MKDIIEIPSRVKRNAKEKAVKPQTFRKAAVKIICM